MIKIFIADDEGVIRNGIRNSIEKLNMDYSICGEAEDGEMALSLIQELKPDVLIADIRMPIMNGLELSSIVKKSMPWIHIIILSGHDEFEYAQQAVSIGVDEYVLKPFSFAKLLEILEGIREKIRKEKMSLLVAQTEEVRREEEQEILKGHFLGNLVSGAISMDEAFVQAKKYHLNLNAKYYAVCRVIPENPSKLKGVGIRAMLKTLFEQKKNCIIVFLHGADRLVLIIMGDTEDETLEQAYEAVQVLQHELERCFSLDSYAGIGSIVRSAIGIAQSYQDADLVLGSGLNKILSFTDHSKEAKGQVKFYPNMPLEEKLRHARKDDVPTIVENHFKDADEGGADSILFRYYLLTDLVMTAVRTIGSNSLDIVTGESPREILSFAASKKEAVQYGIRILERMVVIKGDSFSAPYSEEINKAKEYIEENFASPSISLHTVAAAIGFSPNHFSTVFSQQTGEKFIEYLTRRRIKEAKYLLTQTDTRLSDIAWMVGYNDSHYFSYVFKKHLGVSPSSYRSNAADKKD